MQSEGETSESGAAGMSTARDEHEQHDQRAERNRALPYWKKVDVPPSDIAFSPPKRTGGASAFKGKDRAIEANASELAQEAVTYRHLLSPRAAGATSPLRVIVHIDIDAAYAAMEMARLSIDPAQPVAVQQWNGLIAVNYPARAFGITRHEPPAEAVKKCPGIQLVHVATYRHGDAEPGYWDGAKPETHKVSLDYYRRESLKILKIFGSFFSTVEKASIDESYIDASTAVRAKLLERYPFLSSLPEDMSMDSPLPMPKELGIKVDWSSCGNVIPLHGKKDGDEMPARSQEEEETTWADVMLSIGSELVAECRSAVHTQLGYTCSAGIARNKMLAKLCSAWKKPNNQTLLRNAAAPAFLHDLNFQKIRNLGGKFGHTVAETYEANTVGDLLEVPLQELQAKMGTDAGLWVWEIVRGVDYSEVEPKTQVKSMLSSKNFKPAISKYSDVSHWLSILATELALRLSEARELSPGLWPKTIVFSHRSTTYISRSHQAPFPFTSSLTSAYILKHADKLFRVAHGEKVGLMKESTPVGPYTNLQISFSGLERLEEGQRGIEGFLKAKGTREQQQPAASSRATPPPVSAAAPAPSRPRPAPVAVAIDVDDDDEPAPLKVTTSEAAADKHQGTTTTTKKKKKKRPKLPTYTCTRCRRSIELPQSAVDALSASRYAADEVQSALSQLETEHKDWHFGRDLIEGEMRAQMQGRSSSGRRAGAGPGTSSSTNALSSSTSKKRKSEEPEQPNSKRTKEAASSTKSERGQQGLSNFWKR